MRRFPVLAAMTAGFLLAVSGVAFADAEVTIGDDGLQPETVRADVREDIVWTNATDAAVSLVGEEPSWESGAIEPGATFSIQITREGEYAYASEDGSLEGRIVVGQAGAAEDGEGEDDTVDEPASDGGGDDGAGDAGEDDEAVEMPDTGMGAMAPGAVSLVLIASGTGLLLSTSPQRRPPRR